MIKMKQRVVIASIGIPFLLLGGLLWTYRSQSVQMLKDAALLRAVQHGNQSVAIRLLGEGANPNARLNRNVPKSFREYLLRLFQDMGKRSSPRNSPTVLLLSLETRSLSPGSSFAIIPDEKPVLVRALLDHGADPNAVDVNGNTALIEAASYGFVQTADLLLNSGANVNHVSSGSSPGTALNYAAQRGDKKMANLLLSMGADVNLADSSGTVPLGLAVGYGHAGIARQLIEKGAKVNSRSDGGFTPLIRAAEGGHLDCIKLLLSSGADPKLVSDGGYAALRRAREEGRVRAISLLEVSEASKRYSTESSR